MKFIKKIMVLALLLSSFVDVSVSAPNEETPQQEAPQETRKKKNQRSSRRK